MNQIQEQFKDITLATAPTELETDKQQMFTVSNPMKVQKHIKYTVKGVDGEGPFEEVRRFSEFFALQKMLVFRWPGIYIPAIPEKKAIGNKDDKFVEERRSLLEKFLKECAKYEYILCSREFKIFARDKGEIDRVLNMMPKQTPMQILEKYRQTFQIHEDIPTPTVMTYKDKIKEFVEFIKRVMAIMKRQKKDLKDMMTRSETTNANYKGYVEQLMKYEEMCTDYYSEQNLTKRILTHPSSGDLKIRIDSSVSHLLSQSSSKKTGTTPSATPTSGSRASFLTLRASMTPLIPG